MNHQERTLADLATSLPLATQVFLRHKLDFCCRGRRTLAVACVESGLDAAAIARELDAEPGADRPPLVSWDDRLAELTEHIEQRYHAALRRDMPSLIEAARKVERVHAAKPAVPAGLSDQLRAFWDEMQRHMSKEESVLFPMIRRGARGEAVFTPIRVLEAEHDDHGRQLERVRELTTDLVAPPHACATWRALYDGLVRIEADLMQHVHLENHVLFRAAVQTTA
jgi:regulator of cell morphogenesis and NO signaling